MYVCDSSAHEAVAHAVAPGVEADHRRTPAPTPLNRRAPGLPDPVHDHALTPGLDPGNATTLSLHFICGLLGLFPLECVFTYSYLFYILYSRFIKKKLIKIL